MPARWARYLAGLWGDPMIYKNKEHTFVIYKGKVVPSEWVLRKKVQPLSMALTVTLEAPAAVLTTTETPAASRYVRLGLSDRTKHVALINATVNGSAVVLAEP